ncbi:hypothetical protein KKH96_03055 [Patescibacteria group bacterium]|nr:hypothetical protein [Patescibacteria group bacterium]
MDYEFGDIINAIQTDCEHFILIFGLDDKDRVLYKIITSKIYRAFDVLCDFFNNYCIGDKCSRKRFYHKFQNRQNKNDEIQAVNLSDVFFLNKEDYMGYLSDDSMVIINSDLKIMDLEVLNRYKRQGLAHYASRLSKEDTDRLYIHLKTSKHISGLNLNAIGKSFNAYKRSLR